MRGISPGALELVEFAQPHNTDSPHLLSALRDLSNHDKHREILPALVAIATPEKPIFDVVEAHDVKPLTTGSLYTERSLRHLDVVLEAPVEIVGPKPSVRLEGHFDKRVGFGVEPIVPVEALLQVATTVASIVRWGSEQIEPSIVRTRSKIRGGERRKLRARYTARLASLLSVDERFRKLIRTVRRSGELANTLVFFTSDNGFLLGEHRVQTKTWLYEESARVPLYVAGPGVPAGGTLRSLTLVTNSPAPAAEFDHEGVHLIVAPGEVD